MTTFSLEVVAVVVAASTAAAAAAVVVVVVVAVVVAVIVVVMVMIEMMVVVVMVVTPLKNTIFLSKFLFYTLFTVNCMKHARCNSAVQEAMQHSSVTRDSSAIDSNRHVRPYRITLSVSIYLNHYPMKFLIGV